ncbi:unnamed protein product [Vitrella brassicaformis CCMP3155]|uniref:RxLR effector protein n=1 Tax=Vitrella brassicaformis (strain CCMP3155) TaxID=1169540 RepID=A0A0G4GL90_VITBC|nr:unnamed protein product [Vitrella brassicaformis CCMP3155]|eukprot:CEM30813.1 unnamed protein product [Vitrella brassicaformis CCMP3155]
MHMKVVAAIVAALALLSLLPQAKAQSAKSFLNIHPPTEKHQKDPFLSPLRIEEAREGMPEVTSNTKLKQFIDNVLIHASTNEGGTDSACKRCP